MDYKNGKIYTIRSFQTDLIYIGATCSPISKRFYDHKSKYKSFLNGTCKYYITSFEIVKYEDAYTELLEEYPCENKQQLFKREGELIRLHNCVNKQIMDRTQKEYGAEYHAEYYEEHRDKLTKYAKEYYAQNKDKVKEYKEQNKDRIQKYAKEYKKQIICDECGKEYSNINKTRHYHSKFHIEICKTKANILEGLKNSIVELK